MININSPDFFAATQAAISRYGSPEAARSDFEENAPEANDAYIKRYQALSGDAFADPWHDAISATQDAAIAASTQVNAPLVVNGRAGTRFLPPIDSAPPALATATGPAPTRGVRLNDAQRVATLQNALPVPEMPTLPSLLNTGSSPLDTPGVKQYDDYGVAQEQRVKHVGREAVQLFDQLRKFNPDALRPVDLVNPELEKNAKGAPIAGDVVNYHLINDANFQHMLKTMPDKAAATYEALTGRNFKGDMIAQGGANQERYETRDKMLERFLTHGDYDEFGEPFIREFVSNGIGGQSEVQRPLSFGEKAALHQSGGMHTKLGIEPPSGPSRLEGATPAARAAVIDLARKYRKQHPDDSIDTVLARAVNDVRPAGARSEAAQTANEPMPKWSFRGSDFYNSPLNLLKAAGRVFNPHDPGLQPAGIAPFTQQEATANYAQMVQQAAETPPRPASLDYDDYVY